MKLLNNLHLFLIWVCTYPELVRIWRTTDYSGKHPHINYGHRELQTTTRNVFGGLVKLHDLITIFPQCNSRPNILYLISSALPHFPVRLASKAKKAGANIVLNQNGVAYPGWHGDGWEGANRPLKQLHELADYVIYQSKFCKESADKFLGDCGHRNYEILYNPVDTLIFHPGKEFIRRGNRNRILIAGSHWSTYRIFIALDALSIVRQKIESVSMIIAGRFCWLEKESEAVQEVKEYAEKVNVDDCIEIYGTYTQQEAPELMQSCSLLLHTKYNDPCPRLVVEAMACGLPVVYSATGGVPELVGYDAGFGVPGPLDWEQDHPPDAEQLAIGIEKVLSDLERYSQAARQRAIDKFDVKPWLDRHAEIFDSIL